MLKDHLEQLVKVGHLKEFIIGQGGGTVGQALDSWGNTLPLPLGIIEIVKLWFTTTFYVGFLPWQKVL